jgi:hypothetical protein
VSGYYQLNPNSDAYLFPIPIMAIDPGLVSKTLVGMNLVEATGPAKPEKLNVLIDLGRLSTERMIPIGIDIENEDIERLKVFTDQVNYGEMLVEESVKEQW